MGLFGKPKPKQRALTAAGQRIVPETAASIGARRGDWQRISWAYRTSVPELRYVGGFVSTQVGRVRWFVAEAGPEGLEPRKLHGRPPEENEPASDISPRTQQIAIDALERLDLNSRGSSMAGRGAENFEYAGECYLLGEVNQLGQEDWSIRSVSEVKVDRNGAVQLVEPGKNNGRVLDLDTVELFRLWNPDPEYHDWADAKITACLGVLEEIVIYDRQARAAARSRIASGSLLYVPEELSLTRPGSAPVDVTAPGVDDEDDLFMAELTAGMLTPISSDEDPSAIVPLVVRGPAMGPEGQPMKNLIGVVQIPREEVSEMISKRDAAVTKLAHGMDFPPEIITGIGDSNHWTGWLVSDATIKNHLEPRCENFADSLTASYLRETCLAQGCPAEEVAKLCVWFDATELSQPADPMGVAKDLWDRDIISDGALARAGGYEDKDMPGAKEKIARQLAKGRITPQAVPLIVALEASDLASDPALQRAVKIAEELATPTAALPPASPRRPVIDISGQRKSEAQATPGQPVPQNVIPDTTKNRVPALTSAADTRSRVEDALSRQLGQIDQRAVAELGGFIDAAIMEIVRQAANRIRSGAQRQGAASPEKAMFADASGGRDAVAVVAAAGPDYQWTVSDEQALEGALDRIRPQWLKTVTTAAQRVSSVLRRMLGRAPSQDFPAVYRMRAEQAWPRLAELIRRTAIDVLHGRVNHPNTDHDDQPVLPRSAITSALTEVGGLAPDSLGVGGDGLLVGEQPATGLAAGQTVLDEVAAAGGAVISRVWQWDGSPRDPFPAHLDLDEVEFDGWKDPKLAVRAGDEWIGGHYRPGDHGGCSCLSWLLITLPGQGVGP